MSDNQKLDVTQLLNAIRESQPDMLEKQTTKLAQSKRVLEKQRTRVPARMSKKQTQAINYEIVNQQMTEYLPIVKKNREAVSLDFRHISTNKLYDVSAPKNSEFMKSITEGKLDSYQNLHKVESKLVNGKDLAELIKAKHLLLYKELKQKRIKKIKSKLYHKIKKRQLERQQNDQLAEAINNNKNVLYEELEKLEYKRAHERATLKHSNNNKYTKFLKRYGDVKDLQ